MEKSVSKRANQIYSEMKWNCASPEYLSLREKDAMWKEALEQAKNEQRK